MMSPEQQAQALADWLAENPGCPPPKGIDDDVVEAVYSLRPDLAPPARVRLNDILCSVQTGPLALPEAPIVAAPVMPSVMSADPAVTPEPANRPWHGWGALGAVAAAAATLLVVAQVALNSGSAPRSSDVVSMGPVASAPRQADDVAPRRPGVSSQELRQSGRAPDAERVAKIRAAAGGAAPAPTLDAGLDAELDGVADIGSVPPAAGQDEWDRTGPIGGLVEMPAREPMSRPTPSPAAEPAVASAPAAAPAPVAAIAPSPPPQWRVETDDAVVDADLPNEELFDGLREGEAAPDVALERAAGSSRAQTVSDNRSRGDRREGSMDEDAQPVQAEALADDLVVADASAIARQRARQLADRQEYSAAFAVLAPFASPSAPGDLIVECVEYAFAAGQWSDAQRIAGQRLTANMPTDTAAMRAQLFDLRARAQALERQDEPVPSTTIP